MREGRELQTTLYTYTKKGCGIFVFRMYNSGIDIGQGVYI